MGTDADEPSDDAAVHEAAATVVVVAVHATVAVVTTAADDATTKAAATVDDVAAVVAIATATAAADDAVVVVVAAIAIAIDDAAEPVPVVAVAPIDAGWHDKPAAGPVDAALAGPAVLLESSDAPDPSNASSNRAGLHQPNPAAHSGIQQLHTCRALLAVTELAGADQHSPGGAQNY